jgi:hypothetical protein
VVVLAPGGGAMDPTIGRNKWDDVIRRLILKLDVHRERRLVNKIRRAFFMMFVKKGTSHDLMCALDSGIMYWVK